MSVKQCAWMCQLIQECSFFIYGDTASNRRWNTYCFLRSGGVCDFTVAVGTRQWIYEKGIMFFEGFKKETYISTYVPIYTPIFIHVHA